MEDLDGFQGGSDQERAIVGESGRSDGVVSLDGNAGDKLPGSIGGGRDPVSVLLVDAPEADVAVLPSTEQTLSRGTGADGSLRQAGQSAMELLSEIADRSDDGGCVEAWKSSVSGEDC